MAEQKQKSKLKENLVIGGICIASAIMTYMISPSRNVTRYLEDKNVPFELVRSQETVDIFIDKYKNEINESAKKYNLPPELIAATIKGENCNMHANQDFKDYFGTAIGLDTSLGVGQIKISTAQELDGKKYDRTETIERLHDPKLNIEYIAKFYDAQLNELDVKLNNRKNILRNPELVHKLGRTYVGGANSKTEEADIAGLGVLSYLFEDSTFKPFGKKSYEVQEIARLANSYLCNLPWIKKETQEVESRGYKNKCSI